MARAIVPNRGGSRRQLKDIPCPQCGQIFRPRNKQQKYCSRACFHVVHGTWMTGRTLPNRRQRPLCQQCGQVAKRMHRKYCSIACRDAARLGKGHTEEAIERMRVAQQKNWASKKNPSRRAEMKRIRMSPEWKAWRTAVFERDNYTCQQCGARCCRLEPHHIKKFADFPELAFNLDNGMTLCRPCHLRTENYGNRKQNKPKRRQHKPRRKVVKQSQLHFLWDES
jgi:5-methylcytosine-specific restriction endonuclease McrA